MAKRYRKARSYKKSYFMAKKRNSSSGGYGGLIGTVVGAGVYGALREKMSNALSPLTSKIPLGNISDEIALGGIAVILDRTLGKKMPMLKPVLKGAIIVESARIGEAIINGQIGMGSNSSDNSFSYL
jgi:hypothetical protein